MAYVGVRPGLGDGDQGHLAGIAPRGRAGPRDPGLDGGQVRGEFLAPRVTHRGRRSWLEPDQAGEPAGDLVAAVGEEVGVVAGAAPGQADVGDAEVGQLAASPPRRSSEGVPALVKPVPATAPGATAATSACIGSGTS